MSKTIDIRAALASQQQATERCATERAQWRELQESLPVATDVVHSYTSHRRTGTCIHGADHIMLRDGFQRGRLRRIAGKPMCYVPSSDRDLRHFSDPIPDRMPTCKACMHLARRLAGEQLCPNGCGPLQWVDDNYYCPKCEEEWPED